MVEPILGARIREKRRILGVTQVEMARRIGISASYLNLIERNKRRIGGALLQRTAQELGLTPSELDGADERRLVEEIADISANPSLAHLGPEQASAGEFVGRFPGWSRTVAALARSERSARDRVRALSERLNHDPFLGESVHRMLTHIAAIRSSAEILEDYRDMSEEERLRFDAIVLSEARALSEDGEALANYFDSTDTGDRLLTPQDEVDALFADRANRIDEIEAAILKADLKTDAKVGKDRLHSALDLASSDLKDVITDILDNAPQVQTAGGRARAERALLSYSARAIVLRDREFAATANASMYDAEAISAELDAPLVEVLKRFTSLPSGSGHPRFGFIEANASGSLVDVLVPPGFTAPRYAPPCPLWVLFAAQRTPGEVLRQRAVFGNGAEYLLVARAQPVRGGGFHARTHFRSQMLVVPFEDAAATVYGIGTALQPEDVGPACRLCARASCTHRVEDPLHG